MRLLEIIGNCNFRLTEDLEDDCVPEYTILSHTWGEDKEEVTFHDLQEDGRGGRDKKGYYKLEFCAEQTKRDGHSYFWADTCCIDKKNNVELNTAITSMFRWYQRAKKCYVYLADVPRDDKDKQGSCSVNWESDCRACRWFTRGWTLQELLSPHIVEFYDRRGKKLGDKASLETQLCDVTGIPAEALRGRSLSSFTYDERLSWQRNRTTKKPEDRVYSLMGICGVSMVPIYGEGLDLAMARLRREMDDLSKGVGRQNFAIQTLSSLNGAAEVPKFVGRENELEQIDRALSSDGRRRTVVLHGLGGIGKTQTAIAYATRHTHNYSGIFWFNVQDETSLKQSFVKAAERILDSHPIARRLSRIDLNGDLDVIVNAVNQWLSEIDNTRWLAIYDGYNNPKLRSNASSDAVDIIKYLPSADQGSVIVTTISSQVRIGHCISIRKLVDLGESLEILSAISGRDLSLDDEDVSTLIEKLDGLPLALATAGAYLDQITISIAEYLELYDTSWRKLHENEKSLETYENRTLYSTWNVSLDRIQHQNELSAKLLKLWCYFHNQDLWYEMLSAALALDQSWIGDLTRDRHVFHEAMRVLCNYGLVEGMIALSENVGSTGYCIHGCVHSWIIHVLNVQWDRTMAHFAIKTIAQHAKDNSNVKPWIIQRRVLPHAERCSNHAGQGVVEDADTKWALHYLGLILTEQSRLQNAEKVFLQALKGVRYRAEIEPGKLTIFELDTIHNLGVVYSSQGKLKKAEETLELVLDAHEHRKEHEGLTKQYCDAMNNLAGLYHRQRKLEEAEKAYESARKGYHEMSRAESLTLPELNVMESLGLVYHDQDRLQKAEEVFDQVLKARQKALGMEHPLTVQIMNNFASLLDSQGRLQASKDMYVQALQGTERMLGAEHISTINVVNNLGILHQKQEEFERAEQMFERALKGYANAFGTEHASTLLIINSLGSLYLEQGKVEQAEMMYTRALNGAEKAVGAEDIRTLKIMNNLGVLYRERGELTKSEEMLKRVVAGEQKALGTEHSSTIRSIHNLAITLHRQSSLEEALEMYRWALRGYRAWPYTDQETMEDVEEASSAIEDCLAIRQELANSLPSIADNNAHAPHESANERAHRKKRRSRFNESFTSPTMKAKTLTILGLDGKRVKDNNQQD